jgi:hypothetical protein
MTDIEHKDMPDDLPLDMEEYVSYADEIDIKEGRKKRKKSDKSEGDTEKGGGETEQGSGGGRKPPTPEEIAAAREAEEDAKQSWLEKLKLIFIAPFSSIIPGTVAYTAENDLSKKAFFLRIGLYNRQIEPTDLADPELIQKLEDRHQERRERFQLGPSLNYVPPKPSGPGAPGGLSLGGTSDSADGSGGDTSGGGVGGMKPVTEGGVSAEAVEKIQVKKASIEERDLMATGSTIDQAKAEIDEYITPEEFIQEITQEAAFSQSGISTTELTLFQAFNVLAKQKQEHVQAVELRRNLRLTDRDGRQESAPTLPDLHKH